MRKDVIYIDNTLREDEFHSCPQARYPYSVRGAAFVFVWNERRFFFSF